MQGKRETCEKCWLENLCRRQHFFMPRHMCDVIVNLTEIGL